MLLELRVKNFALIDQITINFKNGLNIISGETGAGKSILLKSLALLMGAKANGDVIKSGCPHSTIEGCFDISLRPDILHALDEIGIDTNEGLLVVRRVISNQGKSRIYLNDCHSSLLSLKKVVAPMIEVSGRATPLIELTNQQDNRNLQSKSYHLDILDTFSQATPLRSEYFETYKKHQRILKNILELNTDDRLQAQRLDFLKFQFEEINSLELLPGEDVELKNQVKQLKNLHHLQDYMKQFEDSLYNDDDSALTRIQKILQKEDQLALLDPKLAQSLQPLKEAQSLIEDFTFEIRSYVQKLSSDPGKLTVLEEKLSLLRHLQKKYGDSIEDILHHLKSIEAEIENISQSESRLIKLQEESHSLALKMEKLAHRLHGLRLENCTKLENKINFQLKDLDMKGIDFIVKVDPLTQLGSTGSSNVEFLINTSKDENPLPISKIASGGELSRILLGIKCSINFSDLPRTYIFDEVDTGVSGATAEKVGFKLKATSKGQQAICVTHLPQVASFADHHFLICKSVLNKNVSIKVSPLKPEKRVLEIARLISGENITKSSLEHARQLLKKH